MSPYQQWRLERNAKIAAMALQGASAKNIAAQVMCSLPTVYNVLRAGRAADIDAPFKPRLYDFTYEGLYGMRIEHKLSLEQIARKYGCDHTTVLHALVRLGIPTKRALIGPDKSAGDGWVKEVGACAVNR